MDTSAVIETLLQWALGLVGLAIIAIVAGYIDTAHKLALLMQTVNDHILLCEKLHSRHDRELDLIRQDIRALKKD